jgi:hypothetical protein
VVTQGGWRLLEVARELVSWTLVAQVKDWVTEWGLLWQAGVDRAALHRGLSRRCAPLFCRPCSGSRAWSLQVEEGDHKESGGQEQYPPAYSQCQVSQHSVMAAQCHGHNILYDATGVLSQAHLHQSGSRSPAV